jgi:DNA primase
VQSIENPFLIAYLKERRISIEAVKQYCKEVHYLVNGKPYFAVGFPNNSGGYELRNRYFKGCTSKDITGIQAGGDACLVFEGFMDALSFLTMKRINQFRQNTVILNSVANLPKAENYLRSQEKVYTFLDNDEAGRQVTARLKSVCKSLSDQSGFYARYKDLNDYLMNRQPKQEKKQSKGLRR